MEGSGERRWRVQEAVEITVVVPVSAASLFQRFRSREQDFIADEILAALGREFGGHGVRTATDATSRAATTRLGPNP